MRFWCVPLFIALALLATGNQPAARAQSDRPPSIQDTNQPGARPKLIGSPFAPYPNEAFKKKIEGKVTLSITVDANGHVSDAKPLSGPPELIQAAIDSVKQWQYEPPLHAPVTLTVKISWGFPRECPGAISERGEVSSSCGLRNEKGLVLSAEDDPNWRLPPYPEEDRKAGIAGEMILSLTVNAKGDVTNVRVVKSLSPHLDEAAVDTARAWKYKIIKGNPESLPDDFQIHIFYRATCLPQF